MAGYLLVLGQCDINPVSTINGITLMPQSGDGGDVG
jgi:hypothetical protein